MHNTDLLLAYALGSKVLSHGLINGDNSVSQPTTNSFLTTQKADNYTSRFVAPAHIEFWHRIMNVQNQLASPQPGDKGRQYQHVGHVMDMNDIKSASEVQSSEFQTTHNSCE